MASQRIVDKRGDRLVVGCTPRAPSRDFKSFKSFKSIRIASNGGSGNVRQVVGKSLH